MPTASIAINRHALRALRRARGMTKAELAREAVITPSYATMLEAGQRQPSADAFARIMGALGVADEDAPALLASPPAAEAAA